MNKQLPGWALDTLSPTPKISAITPNERECQGISNALQPTADERAIGLLMSGVREEVEAAE